MTQDFEAGSGRHPELRGAPDGRAEIEHPTARQAGEMMVLGQVTVEATAPGVRPFDEQALADQQPQVAIDGPEAHAREIAPGTPEHPFGGGMDVGGAHGLQDDPPGPRVPEPTAPERLDVRQPVPGPGSFLRNDSH